MNIVDMCKREKEITLDIVLNIDKWETIDPDIKDIISNGWENNKFLNEDGTGIGEDINNVPDDKGGIYVFLLKPKIIPQIYVYRKELERKTDLACEKDA